MKGFVRAVRRFSWLDAPILVKGLLVAAVPASALVASSMLILEADRARIDAHAQADASELVDTRVAAVRTASAVARAAYTQHFSLPFESSPESLSGLRQAWADAIDGVEAATDAQPDRSLRFLAAELRTATEQLDAVTEEALLHLRRGGDYPPDMWTRSETAATRFSVALEDISEAAHDLASDASADFGAVSERTTTRMLVAAAVGVVGAIAGMVLFALTIVRRIRRLGLQARALGEGRATLDTVHSADELGQLGGDLDRAGALLRSREQALASSAETLSFALASGAMGTWEVDLATGHSVWDAQCEAVHGLDPGSFRGSFEAWLALVHPEDRAAVLAAGGQAMAGGGRWTSAYRVVTRDGTLRWVENSGRAVLSESGVVARLVGVASEITERMCNESALRDAILDAQRANEAKSEFLSRVSHELRTPLNAILGFGQLLEMDDLAPSQHESVDQVLKGGRHLLGLIDDVLDISRIESGELALSLEPVAIGELLRETTSLVTGLAAARGVEIVEPDPVWTNVHVRADRRRLKQIVLNLMSNAIKYNRPGGRVELRCTDEGGAVRVAVVDTGIGIAADRIDRLFTPFDRLGAEQTAVDGTGIGLALSQRLAELLGSALTVASTEDVGSTFWLDLRRVSDPAVTAAGADVDDEPGGAGLSCTVLYIEDNPSNLRLVERVVDRRRGMRLIPATTGAAALSIASHTPIDVVLLDMHLPDMGGDEVLTRLRALPATSSTPVVVLTADASAGRAERLRAAGANAFLAKPIDLSLLLATIDDLVLAVSPS